MPHKKREDAEKVAKNAGIDSSQITKSEIGYFVAPQGMKSEIAKKVYARLRAKGKDAETSAKIAWKIEKDLKDE